MCEQSTLLCSQTELSELQGLNISLSSASSKVKIAGTDGEAVFSGHTLADTDTIASRAVVTPTHRSQFAVGTRLLGPAFSAAVSIVDAKHSVPAKAASSNAKAINTAIGSLKPVAIPQLGRLPPINQAEKMTGFFTPTGGAAGGPAAPAADPLTGGKKSSKKPKSAKKEKRKRKSGV